MEGSSTLIELPLASVIPDRHFQYRSGDLETEKLAESIERDGQVVPIIVRQGKEKGTYQLISGYRRYAALQELKKPTVKALVYKKMTDQKAVHVALLENLERQGIGDADRVSTALRLINEGMTKPQVAAAFNQSVRNIERLLKLGKAPTEYLEAVRNNLLTFNQALEAARAGVPVEEVINGERSVSFLRKIGQKSSANRAKSLALSLRYTPGKSDPAELIEKARKFIRELEVRMKQQP